MKLYAVYRTGVYRHECAGIYTSLKNACSAADLCAAKERDSYHYYEVIPYRVNEVPTFISGVVVSLDRLCEAPAVYTARKKSEGASQ